jgi:uracil-DNA glycosylase family 4
VGDNEKKEIQERLNKVHADIDTCTVCSRIVPSLKKPTGMRRGEPGNVMIVGIAPGNREMSTSAAFSGQSGSTLDEWLVNAGAKPENPRMGIYFTSVLKCQEGKGQFDVMAHQCRRFLNLQLEILRPKLIITLGQRPYEELQLCETSYAKALCEIQSAEGLLLTQFGFNFKLLPWPHPSGLNRQLNNSDTMSKLTNSFRYVRPYLTAA